MPSKSPPKVYKGVASTNVSISDDQSVQDIVVALVPALTHAHTYMNLV